MGRFARIAILIITLLAPALVQGQGLPSDEERDPKLTALQAEAENLYSEGDFDGAAALFVELAQSETEPIDRARSWVLAAWLHHLSGDDLQAVELLAKAFVEDPGYEIQRGNYRPAFENLVLEARSKAGEERERQVAERVETANSRLAEGDIEEAKRELARALELLPGDLEALRALALLDEQAGNTLVAIDGYEKILSLIAGGSPASQELAIDVSESLGRLLYATGRPEDSVAILEELVELHPRSASAWNTLGLARRELDRQDDAIVALRRANELSPESSSIARNLGNALIAARRSREAVSVLRSAVTSHPTDASLWLILGAAQRGSGDLRSAAESLTRALRLDPEDQQGYGGLAAATLSGVYLSQGNPQSALAEATRAQGLRPDDARCLAALGMAEYALKRNDLAREHLERALEVDPENPEIMNHLGIVLLRLGHAHRALELFEKAAVLRPDSEAVQKNLALARSQARDTSTSPDASIVVQTQRKRELGASFAAHDPEASETGGVLVEEVPAASPAARGGMRAGDRILRIDSIEVSTSQEVRRLIETSRSRKLAIDLLRKGRQIRIEVRF